MKFEKAKETDIEIIRTLYADAIGSEGCTWDEDYPALWHTKDDYNRDALFCLKTLDGEIIGAISIDKDELVENLPYFHKNGAEIARLVVKKRYQNQGIAKILLKETMVVLKQRGYEYAHFLVSKQHKKALNAYAKLRFNKVGECDLYGGDWWCYEKAL